jgi:hypothetical protein
VNTRATPSGPRRFSNNRNIRKIASAAGAIIEQLEQRQHLTVVSTLTATQLAALGSWQAHPDIESASPADDGGSATPVGFTPAQMDGAYGINAIKFGSVTGDGSGQTIAIVDAYDDPNALSDLNAFSAAFSLPQFNGGTGSPTFTQYNQDGNTSPLPGTDPAGPGVVSWEAEEAQDIEWAHAVAPMANIDLVEASDDSDGLYTADAAAATLPGVSVVSNSWGGDEFAGESDLDSTFVVPGVTFVFSTGDSGAFNDGDSNFVAEYPASSPDVLAVGGTSLTVNAGNTYGGETAYGDGADSGTDGGGGGGISTQESIPSYQVGKINGLSTTNRTTPDVSMEADPTIGAAVYDSYDESATDPWFPAGDNGSGTSLSAQMWGALIAIANQGRTIEGAGTLTGPTQTLPDLYNLPAADFHDITSGSNGYPAGPGYDLATGLGSPVANLLIPALAPPAPVVTAVSVDSTSWSSSFPDASGYAIPTGSSQLTDLPWINLNQVNIKFNEAVNVVQGDLTVDGVNTPNYTISNFSYNATTFTATWTFGSAIGDDKLLLDLSGTGGNAVTSATGGVALDGTWTNGSSTFPSGNSAPGTDFDFDLNVLPGDVKQTGGPVTILDVIAVRNEQLTSAGGAGYSPLDDVDGSGSINILDVIDVRNRQLTTLPSGSPMPPAPTPDASSAAKASSAKLPAAPKLKPAVKPAAKKLQPAMVPLAKRRPAKTPPAIVAHYVVLPPSVQVLFKNPGVSILDLLDLDAGDSTST